MLTTRYNRAVAVVKISIQPTVVSAMKYAALGSMDLYLVDMRF